MTQNGVQLFEHCLKYDSKSPLITDFLGNFLAYHEGTKNEYIKMHYDLRTRKENGILKQNIDSKGLRPCNRDKD